MKIKVKSGVFMDRIPKEREVETLFLFNAIANRTTSAVDEEDLEDTIRLLYSKFLTKKQRPLINWELQEDGMKFYQEELLLIHVPYEVQIDYE